MTQPGKGPVITWYDVLGVLPGASADQVKSQHDAKVSLLRPEFVSGAPSPVVTAATRGREILDAALRVLADPESRTRYDEEAGGQVRRPWARRSLSQANFVLVPAHYGLARHARIANHHPDERDVECPYGA